MHFLVLLGVCLGALSLLAFGVLSVWWDLHGHAAQGTPLLVEDDGLAWSKRYRGVAHSE
jgi:hypothetical protein